MCKKLVWYFKFFRYCWQISKLKDGLDFFIELPADDGKRYHLNLREFKRKIPKAVKSGSLSKPLLVRSEMYHALNDQQNEKFHEEISSLIMMLILWGMERSSEEHIPLPEAQEE